MRTFFLKVLRGKKGNQFWEEFKLPLLPYLNVNSALMEIQKKPVNRQEKRVAPVVWEQGCLEEVCGSCSMLVNGRPRQACTALIATYLEQTGSDTITVAPLTKFPLVRDLIVNRDRMFENLKKVNAWIDCDDSFDRGYGPKISPNLQESLYILSTCMTCGCCTEACPQVNPKSEFIGPAAISQARLFNAHPVGALQKHKRLRPLLQKGGIADCGNAQNCVQVCPKNIPLTESIAVIGAQATRQAISDWKHLPDTKS